ncbi:MAG: hypothetical protein GYA50_04010 [Eubacteriaceae bacterium]|nr:hypothetical protein [Eubacteriaceae bacterium]
MGKYKKLSNPEKFIIISIPLLFLFGSMFHFLYELSGDSGIVGLFAAVNESVWEHSKMIVLPVFLFWVIYYIAKGKKYSIDKNKWFTSALVSLITALIAMPMIFYFYTEAFGVEFLVVDIIILFLVLMFGQLLGLHFYKHSKGIKWQAAVFAMILIIIVFMIFTYYPPHIPLFLDTPSGTYGI